MSAPGRSAVLQWPSQHDPLIRQRPSEHATSQEVAPPLGRTRLLPDYRSAWPPQYHESILQTRPHRPPPTLGQSPREFLSATGFQRSVAIQSDIRRSLLDWVVHLTQGGMISCKIQERGGLSTYLLLKVQGPRPNRAKGCFFQLGPPLLGSNRLWGFCRSLPFLCHSFLVLCRSVTSGWWMLIIFQGCATGVDWPPRVL